MFVVGDNLRALIDQYSIVDDPRSFDETSLCLSLSRELKTVEPSAGRSVVYGDDIPEAWIKTKTIQNAGVIVKPQNCLLGCSNETIQIPLGYIGFVQTKGSLARLFTTIHCCDSQIDPGFNGKVTFEICNLGSFPVKLKEGQPVAQLFIAKTTSKLVAPYSGRYQNADGPTFQLRRR